MKHYDLISIGTGSAMNLIEPIINGNPDLKVAIIDKDEPGGICLTRGCIPTKILVYPADVIRNIQTAQKFGIDVEIKNVNFKKIMDRMEDLIYRDINMIREGLTKSDSFDFYSEKAEFTAPYTLKVGKETIKGEMIFLCTGSKPMIPPIKGIEKVNYHTSDTILKIKELPKKLAIVGGGYIAAEYGHFFSAMGSQVYIIGRNPQFLPNEEPEVSALAKSKLEKYLKIYTNYEVLGLEKTLTGKKKVTGLNRSTGKKGVLTVDEILMATGRASNSDILKPEKGGIETDNHGWIKVNEYLETSQSNVWAFGDATGKYLFKHVANYESILVYYNAILGEKRKVDYHAIPSAVFSHPEIASVGLREKEAIEKYGENNIVIGMQKYEDTAKGEAMDLKDYFVKVIVEMNTDKIIGAHIIGPDASVLIQEIINLMYTENQSAKPIMDGMHIHPALNEVVERAFSGLMPVEHYHHSLEHHH